MAPERTRRALLATLAGLGVAGCATDDGDRPADRSGDETTDRSRAGTPSATASGSVRSSPVSTTETATDPPTATDREPTVPVSVSTAWPVPGADQERTSYAAGASGPTGRRASSASSGWSISASRCPSRWSQTGPST